MLQPCWPATDALSAEDIPRGIETCRTRFGTCRVWHVFVFLAPPAGSMILIRRRQSRHRSRKFRQTDQGSSVIRNFFSCRPPFCWPGRQPHGQTEKYFLSMPCQKAKVTHGCRLPNRILFEASMRCRDAFRNEFPRHTPARKRFGRDERGSSPPRLCSPGGSFMRRGALYPG